METVHIFNHTNKFVKISSTRSRALKREKQLKSFIYFTKIVFTL